jgi:hypothetical protein
VRSILQQQVDMLIIEQHLEEAYSNFCRQYSLLHA